MPFTSRILLAVLALHCPLALAFTKLQTPISLDPFRAEETETALKPPHKESIYLPILKSDFDGVGRLYSEEGAIADYPCSSFLISPKTVVTAAHCVADIVNDIESVHDLIFVPFAKNTSMMEAPTHVVSRTVTLQNPRKIPVFWDEDGILLDNPEEKQRDDLVLLILKDPVTQALPLDIFLGDLAEVQTERPQLFQLGFPGFISEIYSRNWLTPPAMGLINNCAVNKIVNQDIFRVNCEVTPGMSGGPLLVLDGGKWKAMGVASASGNSDSTYISLKSHYDWIRANME